jgi:hypothetical protein
MNPTAVIRNDRWTDSQYLAKVLHGIGRTELCLRAGGLQAARPLARRVPGPVQEAPVLGVVVNMSGFACPKCGEFTHIFRSGAGRQIANDMGVPFLGSIPLDAQIGEACDSGQAFVRRYAASPTATLMRTIMQPSAALMQAS